MVNLCIDDVLLMIKNVFKEHKNSLDKVLQRLAEAGLNLNEET